MATLEEEIAIGNKAKAALEAVAAVCDEAYAAGLLVNWGGINRGPNPGRRDRYKVFGFNVTKDLTPDILKGTF